MLNALTGPGKIIVASAGNAGEDNLHGQLTLSGSTPQNMTLVVPPYTPAPGTAKATPPLTPDKIPAALPNRIRAHRDVQMSPRFQAGHYPA